MFKYDLLSKNTETLEVQKTGTVTLYNTDNLEALSKDIESSKESLGVGLVFDTNNVGNSVSGVYFNNGVKTNFTF